MVSGVGLAAGLKSGPIDRKNNFSNSLGGPPCLPDSDRRATHLWSARQPTKLNFLHVIEVSFMKFHVRQYHG